MLTAILLLSLSTPAADGLDGLDARAALALASAAQSRAGTPARRMPVGPPAEPAAALAPATFRPDGLCPDGLCPARPAASPFQTATPTRTPTRRSRP